MSLFTRKNLLLVVTSTAIQLSVLPRRKNRAFAHVQSVDFPQEPSPDAVSRALSSISSENLPRGASITVLVSSPLLRLFLVTPPSNATRFEDLTGAALFRFSSLYGADPDLWHVSAAWSVSRPFLACAAPVQLLAAITQFTSAHKLNLSRIGPLALEDWRQLSATPESWLLSKEHTQVSLLICVKKGIQAIRHVRWSDDIWHSVENLYAAVALEARRLDIAQPCLIYGAGDIPSSISETADPRFRLRLADTAQHRVAFRRGRRMFDIDLALRRALRAKPTIGALTFFAMGLLCLATVAAQFMQLAMQEHDLRGQLATMLERASAHQRTLEERPVAVLQAEQVTSVNNAIRQINLPWHRLLRDIEAATPKDIALLSIQPDAEHSSLKGTAEAPTPSGMLNYLSQLKNVGKFESVVLTRHELNEQDPMRPYRFQFEAHWQEAQN